MTAQIPDFLKYGGKEFALCTNPLESYLEQHAPRPNFIPEHTANWRGYIAEWEIKDDKLYLVSLSGTVCIKPAEKGGRTSSWCHVGHRGECESRTVGLSDIFEITTGMVFAEWFSEDLRIPDGELVEYVHLGYGSRHERNLFLIIENGVVVGRRILGDEAYQRELEFRQKAPSAPSAQTSLWSRLWRAAAPRRS